MPSTPRRRPRSPSPAPARDRVAGASIRPRVSRSRARQCRCRWRSVPRDAAWRGPSAPPALRTTDCAVHADRSSGARAICRCHRPPPPSPRCANPDRGQWSPGCRPAPRATGRADWPRTRGWILPRRPRAVQPAVHRPRGSTTSPARSSAPHRAARHRRRGRDR